MRRNETFCRFCDTCESHLQFDSDTLKKLSNELYCSVYASEEIFKSKYAIQFFYWLYIESPFAPLVRVIIDTMQKNISRELKKHQS